MRVLIVGGGIAGLALAAELARQDREPVVIEQARRYGDSGYAISLYPFGSAVLRGIGAYPDFAACSVELKRYEIADRRGGVIRSLDFAGLMAGYGPTYMTARSTLIELLRAAGGERVDLRMGTTAREFREAGSKVEVSLSDGSCERFDLVVGCDGIGSATRELLFGPQPGFDTGWVGWTWWGGAGIFPPETARELWLAGALFGVYPAPGRAMYLVAVPTATAPADGLSEAEVTARLRGALAEAAAVPEIEAALSDARQLWPWRLRDVRSRRLRRGRVVLCGDAGTAFLPTAGIGASAALRSAAALADELSRADARRVPLALDHYLERTARPIRANQRDSRRLAHAMCLQSKVLCLGRDVVIRHMPVRSMIGSLLAAMQEQI
jgi:FAD-dependent urate hydroxylase